MLPYEQLCECLNFSKSLDSPTLKNLGHITSSSGFGRGYIHRLDCILDVRKQSFIVKARIGSALVNISRKSKCTADSNFESSFTRSKCFSMPSTYMHTRFTFENKLASMLIEGTPSRFDYCVSCQIWCPTLDSVVIVALMFAIDLEMPMVYSQQR